MTAIEWTHRPGTVGRVWNPVSGCLKVSDGCRHCYAEKMADRFWATQYPPIEVMTSGEDGDRFRPRRFGDVQCHDDRLVDPLRWRKPATVFVNSMSDLFEGSVPDAFIDRVFSVMRMAPQHTFIVLTKRASRMLEYLGADGRCDAIDAATGLNFNDIAFAGAAPSSLKCLVQRDGQEGWPLPNVWLGVSVENQATADKRVPLLLQTPAAVRVVSAEPLLGPIDLTAVRDAEHDVQFDAPHGFTNRRFKVHWLILGGESGPNARPCDVAWIRSLVRQAKAARVPVFVKQLGANAQDDEGTMHGRRSAGGIRHDFPALTHPKGADPTEWPSDLRVREWPDSPPERLS